MNRNFLIFILVTISEVLCQTSTRVEIPEDATLNFIEFAKKYVHKAEEYDIVSEGYILKLFRIPGDKRRPVLCIHGNTDSADSFILRGNTSLAVGLSRNKYDVWVMNYRGNKYSRRHTSLNPNTDPEFWNFSVQEIGYYDVPAVIDFILNKTGEQQLSALGYSEGTTTMYVLGATRPEYNDKIKVFISLAPICFLQNVGPVMALGFKLAPIVNDALSKTIQYIEVMGHGSPAKALFDELCSEKNLGYQGCLINIFYLVTGANIGEIEPEFFPIIIGHFPSGTSWKNFFHLVQIGQSKIFRNYDYGSVQNMVKYGRPTPPEYDLNKVTMKMALIAAKNDLISTIEDVELLRKRLPNVVEYRVMKNMNFNHVDYIWGKSAHKMLFPHIFRILNKYNK